MTKPMDEWRDAKIGEVLVPQGNGKRVQQGWSPRCLTHPADDDTWGVLKTTAIQAGSFDPTQNKALPETMTPKPGFEVHSGDILITCAGPRARCGVPALVRRTRPKLMMSGKMYRLRPTDDVDPSFLELWLLSPDAQSRIDAMKTGISDSGLNLTHGRFLELPVPVPPLDEQRRIVAILEDHLSRLDATDAMLAANAERVRAWRRAEHHKAIWETDASLRPVRELLSELMRNGHSARAVRGAGGGIRTLTLTAVTRGEFVEKFTKMTAADPQRVEALWLQQDDILVQRSNTPELVGTTARYSGDSDWAIFPDLLIRLRANESVVSSGFLAAALSTERAHQQLRDKAKGLAGSMPKIDQAAIGSAVVPIPALSTQTAVVARLDDVDRNAMRLGRSVEVARIRSAALRGSLLEAAFSGRLIGESSDLDHAAEPTADQPIGEHA